MCGIVGYFRLNLKDEERLPLLKRMCDAIVHRGPDDEGYFIADSAGLGMRRLSIIDLVSGHQPMSSQDGGKHIIFNGEVYNFQHLRIVLARAGYGFKTTSDTEVVLAQYEQDDMACVQKFNGMFAIAIWDENQQRLFLARDRMGVKPLYYYWDGKNFLFASEIKALLASGMIKKQVNEKAIWDYLTFRYVPQPQTIWKNIYKLPPAHTLTISTAHPEPEVKRYWDIPYTDNVSNRPLEDYVEEFTHLFLDAVRLRLIADVPLGILLSGGLDSSAVSAAVAELHNARYHSFSVAFADSPETDEIPYARLAAQHVKTEHSEIIIGQKDFIDFLPEFVYYTDEPLADLASIPLYYVCKLARQNVKVVLSGEGGDEILGGYEFDLFVRNFDQRRAYQSLSQFHRFIAQNRHYSRLFGFDKKYIPDNTPLDYRLHQMPPSATLYLSDEQKRKLFKQPQPWEDSMKYIKMILQRIQCSEPLHQILYIWSQDWLVEDLLMKADKMSMANSIELRTPFLDYRLVEWAARSPSMIKVSADNNGNYLTKRVLREFASTRLPSEIITREKKGFPVPVYQWLSKPLKPWVSDILDDPQAKILNWFDPAEIHKLLSLGTSENSPIMPRHYLWALLILELWSRAWLTA